MTIPSTENDYAERIVEIRHEEGLHMRPAMQFVDCANSYESKISVQKDTQIVDGKSIMQLTMLAATPGTQLKLVARGSDAQEAVKVLAKLLEEGGSDKAEQASPQKKETEG